MAINTRFNHIGISVAREHLDATIAWYEEKLDFSIQATVPFQGSTYVFLVNGNVTIELCSAGARATNPATPPFEHSHDVEKIHHYCVAVDDLDTVLADLAGRDVWPVGGPMVVPQIRQRIAFIRDNLGNIIELTTDLAPDSASA